MAGSEVTACFVPDYFLGPCNESVIRDEDGSVFYNATTPYVGPVYSNQTVYWLNGTRINYTYSSELRQNRTLLNVTYEATCAWVVPFEADPDIVSGI